MNFLIRYFLVLVVGFGSGCVRVKTEPIRVEPIYIEITINHKIQKELDDIFDEIDRASQTLEYKELPGEKNN